MTRSRLARRGFLLFGERESGTGPTLSNSSGDPVLDYAGTLLGQVREEIDRADAKASILLAASGVVIGAMLAGLLAGTWTPFKLQVSVQWLWWAGAAEAAVGLWCLAWTVYPRRDRHDPDHSWSVGFYGDVLAFGTTAELVTALNRSALSNIDRVAPERKVTGRFRIWHHFGRAGKQQITERHTYPADGAIGDRMVTA